MPRMGRDARRLLLLTVISIGMIVASTLVVDWFVMESSGPGGGELFGLGLRSFRACDPASGVCMSVPIGMTGTYGTFATPTFWVAMACCAAMAFVTVERIRTGDAPPFAIRIASLLALLGFGLAVCTGYVFGPDLGTGNLTQLQLTVTMGRTLAPLLLIVGNVVGMVAMFYAPSSDDGLGSAQGLPVIPQAYVPLAERSRRPSELVPIEPHSNPPTTPPAMGRSRSPTAAPLPMPDHLKGQIQYLAVIAEVTRAGIDARREDGTALLVMWSDVVGAVARRLPESLGGATFVDLVSAAGSTLRVLPWTRLMGDPVPGDGDFRVRNLIELVIARTTGAKLDAATRDFISTSGEAPQLPDAATLAQHDERLA